MTFAPPSTQGGFLPIEFDIPRDNEGMREFVSKRERLTASLLNIKEIGFYQLFEILNGQQWFDPVVPTLSAPLKMRYSFRKTFDLVALNAGVPIPAGPSAFAHNITGITVPTRIFGTATSAGPLYLPLPYAGAAGNNIEIWFDSTNVNINNNFGAALTQCYITFEYLKQ